MNDNLTLKIKKTVIPSQRGSQNQHNIHASKNLMSITKRIIIRRYQKSLRCKHCSTRGTEVHVFLLGIKPLNQAITNLLKYYNTYQWIVTSNENLI